MGPLKSDAVRAYHERRAKAHAASGWCPKVERRQARERTEAEKHRQRMRVTFDEFSVRYLEWAKNQHRSYSTTSSQVEAIREVFGDKKLDEITTEDVEHYLAGLRKGQSRSKRKLAAATVNRYRDRMSGMFRQAARWRLITVNPVTEIPKTKEPGGRILYLPPPTVDRRAYEEEAIRAALPSDLQPLFIVSVHTGLRWSEQINLSWRDVDLHARVITVPRSKHGGARHVPINAVVRSILFDLSLHRVRPGDPNELVFRCRHAQADKFFPKAVQTAHEALSAAERDAKQLEGYTWHGNRHTFASRLIMAGVDLRTVQELGGWKTLKMVERYGHLSPTHLHAAVERLSSNVPGPQNLEKTWTASEQRQVGVS